MKNLFFTPSGSFEPGFYTSNGYNIEQKSFVYVMNQGGLYRLNMVESCVQTEFKVQPKNAEFKQSLSSFIFTKQLTTNF
jgi:hypothetical protein